MTSPMGDLPDWTTLTAPLVLTADFTNVGSGLVNVLFQSVNPFRVWGAWCSVSAGTDGTFAAGAPATWGAQVGDSVGGALVRCQMHFANSDQVSNQALSVAIPGFTPSLSAGKYTINFITDAGITHIFTRASGGIFYSQP